MASNPIRGVAVFLVTVLVIVAAAAVAGLVAPGGGGAGPVETGEDLDNPEYDAGEVVPEPLESGGTVDAEVPEADRGGLVLIDTAHTNRFDRTHVEPLVRELTAAGHEVRFHESGDDLEEQLRVAKAFVVIAPGAEYTGSDAREVAAFTDRGGRLLLVGEPNRIQVQRSAFGVQIVETTVATSTLGSALGVSFDTRYLYNLGTNDGNYKHVLAEPGPEAGLEAGTATVYTGTAVTARGGTDLLVASEGTRLSADGAAAQHAVAVRRDNLVALGDSTMLRSDRHTVADNEAVLAYLVEFLAAGESAPGASIGDLDGSPFGPGPGGGIGGNTSGR